MKKLVLSLLTASCLVAPYALAEDRTAGAQPKQDNSETYKELDLFGDVFERVKAQYVEEKTDKDLVESALNGMLMALDPHSSYMNDEQFTDMQVTTKGEFGGLGIEVTMENGLVKVVSPIDDTPAFKAGILAGDYIIQIDEEPVMGMALSDAVDKMRGKVGTEIKLLVSREGAEAPIEYTLKRDVIKIQSVRSRVEGNAGYLRITAFNQNTSEGLEKAMNDIKAQLGSKLTGYVLDLRNNPGGLLDQAILVSDAFLDKGEIVSTRGRHEEDTKRDNATAGDLADGLPIVVLINGGSASASEIVSGALQDHKRAILLGTKSFGKGSVQTVIPIPGHGAMRLTTARYYTPSGRSIQAKGIDPDIVVEQASIESFKVNRLREENLKGALDHKAPSPLTIDKKPEAEKTEDGKDVPKDAVKGPAKEGESEDYQLMRALDLLSGLSLYKGSLEDVVVKENEKTSAPVKALQEAPPAKQ